MRTVRHRKIVVYKKIAKRCKLFSKKKIVFFFPRMKPKIFSDKNGPLCTSSQCSQKTSCQYVAGKRNGHVPRKMFCDRLQCLFAIRVMTYHENSRPLFAQKRESGHYSLQTKIIGGDIRYNRNIQVGAYQHPLAPHITDIAYRWNHKNMKSLEH